MRLGLLELAQNTEDPAAKQQYLDQAAAVFNQISGSIDTLTTGAGSVSAAATDFFLEPNAGEQGTDATLENGKVISIDTNPSGSSSPTPSPNTPQSGSGTAVETATAETLDMTEELVLVHDETTGEELGYISVMRAPSSIMDDEILAYWYYNLVEPNNYLWCVIVYTDKSDSTGVFAMVNNIEKDIVLRKAADGAWYIADDTKGTFYIPTDSKDGLYKLA